MHALSLTLDTAKNVALGVIVVLAVLAIVAASVVRKVMAKLLSIGLLVILAGVVWSQRSSLENCASQFRDRTALGDPSAKICTFFGKSITVPSG